MKEISKSIHRVCEPFSDINIQTKLNGQLYWDLRNRIQVIIDDQLYWNLTLPIQNYLFYEN